MTDDYLEVYFNYVHPRSIRKVLKQFLSLKPPLFVWDQVIFISINFSLTEGSIDSSRLVKGPKIVPGTHGPIEDDLNWSKQRVNHRSWHPLTPWVDSGPFSSKCCNGTFSKISNPNNFILLLVKAKKWKWIKWWRVWMVLLTVKFQVFIVFIDNKHKSTILFFDPNVIIIF